MQFTWGDVCPWGNEHLGTTVGVIVEIPATDVDNIWAWVVEFDPFGCITWSGHNLVDEDCQGKKECDHE
jgi:hypothetical protein